MATAFLFFEINKNQKPNTKKDERNFGLTSCKVRVRIVAWKDHNITEEQKCQKEK
jgi:hypothetical protein